MIHLISHTILYLLLQCWCGMFTLVPNWDLLCSQHVSFVWTFPNITIPRSTANIYSVTFTPATIRCLCSDSVSPCKHLLFIFNLLHLEPSLGRFKLDLSSCLSKIRRMRPFHTNQLDICANQLCWNFLFKQCVFCIKPSFDSVLYILCIPITPTNKWPPPLPIALYTAVYGPPTIQPQTAVTAIFLFFWEGLDTKLTCRHPPQS